MCKAAGAGFNSFLNLAIKETDKKLGTENPQALTRLRAVKPIHPDRRLSKGLTKIMQSFILD
ncbi:MAG: hypothetical protein LBP37_03285 [Spirochaetaceae bacterium]|jgi:hypothetical protein|nr:hypothetical protein [Spirochaetaceae bacterium]